MSLRWLFQEQRLSERHSVWHIAMSILAPVLAYCIHSLSVWHRGTRLYNAEILAVLGYSPWPNAWIGLLAQASVEGLFTFLIIWLVVEVPIRRMAVWICFVAVWTWYAFSTEVAVH